MWLLCPDTEDSRACHMSQHSPTERTQVRVRSRDEGGLFFSKLITTTFFLWLLLKHRVPCTTDSRASDLSLNDKRAAQQRRLTSKRQHVKIRKKSLSHKEGT